MPHPRCFTPEFRDEAVRLAETSGRSRRQVAEDLGIGLSTLRHWMDRHRDHRLDDPAVQPQEDIAAELKRLRRENEVLRQEAHRLPDQCRGHKCDRRLHRWLRQPRPAPLRARLPQPGSARKAGRIARQTLSTEVTQVQPLSPASLAG